jgi:hypothetical protein
MRSRGVSREGADEDGKTWKKGTSVSEMGRCDISFPGGARKTPRRDDARERGRGRERDGRRTVLDFEEERVKQFTFAVKQRARSSAARGYRKDQRKDGTKRQRNADIFAPHRPLPQRHSTRPLLAAPRRVVASAMFASAFAARFLLAFVFLVSALNKLHAIAHDDAGATLATLAPRLLAAKDAIRARAGLDCDSVLPLSDAQYLCVATAMELVGAVLFIADVSVGAKMLAAFTIVVTPVMHPYWTMARDGDDDASAAASSASAAYEVEVVMFWKNVSMLGGLLTYLAMKPAVLNQRGVGVRRKRRGASAKTE